MEASIGVAEDSLGKWGTRSVLRSIFSYPFIEAGAHKFIVRASERNASSVNLALAMGFREEGNLTGYYPDGASCLILGMLKSECRWIGGSYGKR